jgi:hypothetical protein
MSRPIVEVDRIEGFAEIQLPESARFVFAAPRRGGPKLCQIRAALAPHGRLRLSGTPGRIFADFDPGPPTEPMIALDTIVRSDAAGLERMLLSALPHVDEIVLGVDGRSDDATLEVARMFADTVHVFGAVDVGLNAEEWAADAIHFGNARNLGREKVRAPWTLVVDADEYLGQVGDLRETIGKYPDAEHLESTIFCGGVKVDSDRQRLARTQLRWNSPTHNQLVPRTGIGEKAQLEIIEDKNLRATTENARRDAQRNAGIELLVDEAMKGNIAALLHLAKHRAGLGDTAEAVRLVEDYRLRIEPHSVLADERAITALTLGFRFYYEDNLAQAEVWALRTLLDGPRIAAFCLLGDIAEEQCDLPRARGWYEAACAITTPERVDWPGVTEMRWGRLEGIKLALIDPATAPVAYITTTPETTSSPPTSPETRGADQLLAP